MAPNGQPLHKEVSQAITSAVTSMHRELSNMGEEGEKSGFREVDYDKAKGSMLRRALFADKRKNAVMRNASVLNRNRTTREEPSYLKPGSQEAKPRQVGEDMDRLSQMRSMTERNSSTKMAQAESLDSGSNEDENSDRMAKYESVMESCEPSSSDPPTLTPEDRKAAFTTFGDIDVDFIHDEAGEDGKPREVKICDASPMECVVQMLQGTKVQKKVALVKNANYWLWLDRDLARLHWRHGKDVETVSIKHITSLVVDGRKLTVQFYGNRYPTYFQFFKIGECTLWFKGLHCMTPEAAFFSLNGKDVAWDVAYDINQDSFEGVAYEDMETWNQFKVIAPRPSQRVERYIAASTGIRRRFYTMLVLKNLTEGPYALKNPHRRETAIIRKLNHPNIVWHKEIIADKENDTVAVISEYSAHGGLLCDQPEPIVFPEESVRRIALDILQGLFYLHKLNIAHRNVAPYNIVRVADGTYKLSDFSLAAAYDVYNNIHPRRTRFGYAEYTAPELCPTPARPPAPPENYACDVWSLGATMFMLLFGHPPFAGEDDEGTFKRVCVKKLRLPENPKISKRLRDVLTSTLQKDLKKRPTVPELLKNPWFRSLETFEPEPIVVSDSDARSAFSIRSHGKTSEGTPVTPTSS